jgi:hypothetical protein
MAAYPPADPRPQPERLRGDRQMRRGVAMFARSLHWTGPPDPSRDDPPFPWPRRSPNWPRRSARWTAHGGCTAGKPRSTPPSLPPASASSCGSGRCTSLAQVVQQAQRASNVPREVRHERNGWSPLLGGGWFGLAVQWLPGDGVSLARVARSKIVMISRE